MPSRPLRTTPALRYINVMPWFCSTTCNDIIDNIVVYKDSDHITATYSRYLENVLAAALGFPPVR